MSDLRWLRSVLIEAVSDLLERESDWILLIFTLLDVALVFAKLMLLSTSRDSRELTFDSRERISDLMAIIFVLLEAI